jgi:two-component system sensor histidine kinase QseC
MTRTLPRRSIRRQLLLVLLGAVTLAWIATTIVSYFDARHELGELLDAHLAQSASLLVAQLGHESAEIDIEHSPILHPYGQRVAFQFWENGTALRLHSANAPNSRLSPKSESFDDANIEGARWRVFSGWDAERRYLVQVGERLDAREEIVATIAKNMLWPLLVALPALGVLIWLGVERATRPLRLLNRQLEARAPDNLAALDVNDAPAEVAPLVASLNRLFARVRSSMENERRFTGDAAHELRTPLAGLRAQAQVARGASDAAERSHALDNVIAGCDQAAHLVDQLLTLARLEPDNLQGARERCDLAKISQAAIAEVVPMALAKSMEIEFTNDAPPEVRGDARLLRILLRNLLDNAVRYSPANTAVKVRSGEHDGVVFISVADRGPGVTPEARARLGERFHRLPGAEGAGAGTGLGLSISKRIAQIHGASISFDETAPGLGLAVTVSFPARRERDRGPFPDGERCGPCQ